MPTLLAGVAIFFTIEVTVMSIYVLALLSRFYMKLPNLFMTAFVLAHKHLLTSVLLIVTIIAVNIATMFIPILMFVLPALMVAILSYFVQKVFTKHIAMAADQETEENVEEVVESESVAAKILVEQPKVNTEAIVKEEEKEDEEFLKYI